VRPLAASLLGLFCLIAGGCGEPSTPTVELSAPSDGRLAPYLTEVGLEVGLDVVQIAGGDNADYIIESLGTGGAWLDYDLDGDADLYLVQGATPESPFDGPADRMFRNDGDGDGDGLPSFVDVTESLGLGDREWGFGAAVADYDNDGDPDIYLTQWGANRLYRNDDGMRFVEVAAVVGVDDPRWSASAAWSDVDHDGDLDLYVANYVTFDFDRYPARGEMPADGKPCVWRGVEIFCGPRNLEAAADRFYRNDGDTDGDGNPNFVDATESAGLSLPEPLYSLAVHAFDADNDGDDDLYVANDSVQNVLLVNQGDGTFVEESIFAGLAYNEQGNEQAGMGIASSDYDSNGQLDLVVSNFSHDHDTLYRNDGDLIFTDVSYNAGIGTPSYFTLGWGIDFIDLDLDGHDDLYSCRGHVYPQIDTQDVGSTFKSLNGLLRNNGAGQFVPFDGETGPAMQIQESSRVLLPVDLEGDGDLDLLVTQINARPSLILNSGEHGHWLAVRLRGDRSNSEGIGARVIIESDGRIRSKEIRREASYAGSTLPVAHFGLGSSNYVDRIIVRWPSGAVSVQDSVDADQLLWIDEPLEGVEASEMDAETLEQLRALGYIQ